MDGLNNNTINSFDLNYGNTIIFGDDFRNHNESRTTARVTPLTSVPYSSQECSRMNMDRMKDRHINILVQKNKQLQMEISSLQHRASTHLPMMHEYEMLDQYGISSNHFQLKLLTTALDEKSEELEQAKEEHDLIMKERVVVHKELREQTAEIERLTKQNYYLKEQLCAINSGHCDIATNISEDCTIQLRDLTKENESLKQELAHQQTIIQDLTNEKERTCKQLDKVVNHYRYLKKSFNQKRFVADSKLQQFADEKCEMVTETIKVTDLKMALLNLVMDNNGVDNDTSDSDNNKLLEGNMSLGRCHLEHSGSCHLGYNDRLVEIEGVDVTCWTDDQILDHLSRYGPCKYIRVIILRPSRPSGTFQSWKVALNLSAVESFGLSPLWLVTNLNLLHSKDHINAGDIIQVNENTNGTHSVSVVRLSSSPFTIPYQDEEHSTRHNSISCGNKSQPVTAMKPSIFFSPVLPVKKTKPFTDHEIHPQSLDRLVSVKTASKSKKSNTSIVSAPPIPPRSSTSLQCSFTDNMELPSQDYSDLGFNGSDSVSEKLKMSVHSAFTGVGDPFGSVLSSEIMSASFSSSGDFVSSKMPKLGKCRNLILGVPSQIFNLKQLGLHLLHSKNDQQPSSKSDVDVSVVNQIFIRYIEPNSSAKQAGLFEGDEIISINNQPVCRMTSEEAEHILLTNTLKQHNLKKEHKKLCLRIKVQFNPLKMYELCKEPLGSSNVRFTRFTRSMYDDSRSGSFANEKWNSHRLHVIRSSSNLNLTESPDRSLDIVEHLLTKTRTVRINMCTVLSQIKIVGGSAVGIFISNLVYRDKEAESIDKESIGNRLAPGDKIIDINGESYQRAIGEDVISSLNTFAHHVTLTVLFEPSGLLAINSDPFCQEHFYMEAMFSFSDIDGKCEKSSSLSTRLDTFGLGVYFVKNYHLAFEKGDILLVDATILPSNMTRRPQDTTYLGSDWHAWVIDRTNNKIRSGMIPSALWIQKMIVTSTKSNSYRSPLADKNSRFSMRSTPSSPKSDISTFLSSNSTHIVSQPCSRHHRQNSLSQKLFRRFSFRNSFHSTTVSADETNRKIPFFKDVTFRPLKRIAMDCTNKRPVILLGPHSETIAMILASKWSSKFVLSTLKATLEPNNIVEAHRIISPVTIKAVSDLHQANIYPIVLLLKYKSAKEIRTLKIGKSTLITVNKSDSFKLLSQIKEFETLWSHLINGNVTPTSANDSFYEILEMIDKIQREDIWLRVDRYQYSA